MSRTLLIQSQSSLESLSGGDHSSSVSFVDVVVNELSSVAESSNCSQQSEQNEEQQQWLGLVQGNTGLNVELGKGTLSGKSLSKDGGLHKQRSSSQLHARIVSAGNFLLHIVIAYTPTTHITTGK